MTVTCKICGAQFQSFRGLNGHMNKHRPLRAEPNIEGYTDDLIMDIYLDEGESYDDAHYYARRAQNKLTHGSEDFQPRTGSRVTKGRKHKWIPVAVEYLKQWGSATAAEIIPNLPDFMGSGRPINVKALSSRLMRMPDIFSVDKTTRPYTFSLVETKEAESFGAEYGPSVEGMIENPANYHSYWQSFCEYMEVRDAHTAWRMVEKPWKWRHELEQWVNDPEWFTQEAEDMTDAELEQMFDEQMDAMKQYKLRPCKVCGSTEIGPEDPSEGMLIACDHCGAEYNIGGDLTMDVRLEDGTPNTFSPDYLNWLGYWKEIEKKNVNRTHKDFLRAKFPEYLKEMHEKNAEYVPCDYPCFECGQDALTPKGVIYYRLEVAPGKWDSVELCEPCFRKKKEQSFGVEAYDEKITVWICNACNRRFEDQNDAEDCCEGLDDYDVPYFDGKSKELREVHLHEAEFEQLSDASMAVSDRYDVNVGYIVASDGDDDKGDDDVTIEILDDDFEPIAELELGQTWHDYNPDDEDYFHAESNIKKVTVYVEREDNRPWKYVTFEMPTHVINNHNILHEAIENRLMDILQEPFGGWDLISIKELDEESFEANFNPDQPRDTDGRWVDPDESDFIKTDRVVVDVDADELMALAKAIRIHDSTFPDVEMLLEQIGDNPENRQLIFQEMLDVLNQTINEVMGQPTVETPEEYYKYILEEEVEDEMDRLYRQANYYAQFKTSADIDEALEELYFQFQMAKEMGAEKDIVNSIEKDINFVELVSRVQDMQRQYTAETLKADWNPKQPRVPCTTCKKPEPCPCPPKPGKGQPPKRGRKGTNVMPPIPTPEHDPNHWVNRQTGETHRGNKPTGAQWRAVEKVPVVINGKQRYIDNIMDEIVKIWPPSSVVYRRNPPYVWVVDNKINLQGLNIKGIKIDGHELTYE